MSLEQDEVEARQRARHWRYFLILESEFERVLRFIEPDEANHDTYSLELAKQLLSVASQFEVIIKLFLAERSPGHSASRMEDLREVLLQVSPHAPEIEITFLPTNETLAPFSPLSWLANQVDRVG